MAYCWTGSHSRWATSTGSINGPGRRCTTSGTAPGWAVSASSEPAAARSRAHRLASPPTTAATSDSPARMARRASLISDCWGMPSSTRWVRAEPAPTPWATSRAGSG